MLRTTITRHVGLNARLFATSARHQKSATDSVKDGVKAVHDSASKAALKGVEATATVTDKVKETAGVNAGKAKGEASEIAGKAKGSAEEAAGKAKGTAEEAKGKAKGAMS